jgi:hypothetical protein
MQMSYVTVENEKQGRITLASNAQGHTGSISIKIANQQPLGTSPQRKFLLAMVALLLAALGFNPAARAQDVAPPISGVLGQVQSVGKN